MVIKEKSTQLKLFWHPWKRARTFEIIQYTIFVIWIFSVVLTGRESSQDLIFAHCTKKKKTGNIKKWIQLIYPSGCNMSVYLKDGTRIFIDVTSLLQLKHQCYLFTYKRKSDNHKTHSVDIHYIKDHITSWITSKSQESIYSKTEHSTM